MQLHVVARTFCDVLWIESAQFHYFSRCCFVPPLSLIKKNRSFIVKKCKSKPFFNKLVYNISYHDEIKADTFSLKKLNYSCFLGTFNLQPFSYFFRSLIRLNHLKCKRKCVKHSNHMFIKFFYLMILHNFIASALIM